MARNQSTLRNPNPTHLHIRIDRIPVRRQLIRKDVPDKTSMERKVKIYNSFWLVICCIGLSYHLFDTTAKYLRYSVNSQVIVSESSNIIPPSVSICFAPNEVVIPNKLDDETKKKFLKYQCHLVGNYLANPRCRQVLDGINTKELMETKTVNLTNYILRNPLFLVTEEDKEYFTFGFKCIKVSKFIDKKRELRVSEMDGMTDSNREIMKIIFNASFRLDDRLNFKLKIHNSVSLRYFREGTDIILSAVKTQYILFAVDCQIVRNEYLKYPYESNCIDYADSEYESQGHCFESCFGGKHGNSNDQTGFITTDNYDLLDYGYKHPFIENYRAIHENLEIKCAKKCRKGCVEYRYYPSLLNRYGVEGFHYEIIVNLYLNNPILKLYMTKSFDMNSYIIYLASVTSLWFGCSVFNSVIGAFKACFYFTAKYK